MIWLSPPVSYSGHTGKAKHFNILWIRLGFDWTAPLHDLDFSLPACPCGLGWGRASVLTPSPCPQRKQCCVPGTRGGPAEIASLNRALHHQCPSSSRSREEAIFRGFLSYYSLSMISAREGQWTSLLPNHRAARVAWAWPEGRGGRGFPPALISLVTSVENANEEEAVWIKLGRSPGNRSPLSILLTRHMWGTRGATSPWTAN